VMDASKGILFFVTQALQLRSECIYIGAFLGLIGVGPPIEFIEIVDGFFGIEWGMMVWSEFSGRDKG